MRGTRSCRGAFLGLVVFIVVLLTKGCSLDQTGLFSGGPDGGGADGGPPEESGWPEGSAGDGPTETGPDAPDADDGDAVAADADAADAPDADADAADAADADAADAADAPPGCPNGQTEPCYDGPAGTKGIGACVGGTRTCVGGIWGACMGEILPKTEQCNWADDDCNGVVDDVAAAAPKALTVAASARAPRAAWSGGALGFVWTHPVGADTVQFGTADGAGSRVVPDTLVAPAPDAGAAAAREGALVPSGSGYAAAFIDTSPGAAVVRVAAIGAGGNVAVASTYTTQGGNASRPALVDAGGGIAVVWEGKLGQGGLEDIFFGKWVSGALGATAQVSATNGLSWKPAILWTGADYGVFWQENVGGSWEIHGRRVSAAGAPLGSSGKVLPGSGGDLSAVALPGGPAIAYMAQGAELGVRLAFLTQTWTVTTVQKVTVAPIGTSVAAVDLAADGADLAIVWEETSGGNTDVRFVRVKQDGSAVSPVVNVSKNPGTSWHPSLARMPSGWAIVWEDDGVGGRQLFWSAVCK